MVVTPSNHGCIFLSRVCNMVVKAGALFIAHSFSVPHETHGFGAIAFGHREGWDGASLHFVPNSLGFGRTRLVNTKEIVIEVVVVDAGTTCAATCAGSSWGG
jgi:hypothetical protein